MPAAQISTETGASPLIFNDPYEVTEMSLSPTEVRVALWEAGYRPLSVKSIRQYDPEDRSQGKAPWGNAWTDRARQNPPGCLSEPYSTDSSNTGILCDG